MALDAAVSLVMIPLMLMNIYMNLGCLTIPKKYPDQWANRSIKMNKVFYNICCVLGAICAGIVAFNLFKDLKQQDAIIATIMLVTTFFLSWLRLKQGAVSKEQLEKNKKEIVRKALEAEKTIGGNYEV